MVDRRTRYLNSKGKFPPPGGGVQLLEELESPELSDAPSEGLRPVVVEEPTPIDPVQTDRDINGKAAGGEGKDTPDGQPEPEAWAANVKSPPARKDSEPQDRAYESAIPTGLVRHTGTVLTFDRVETLQGVRADSREKTVNALRQLLDSVSSGDLAWELLQADYDGRAEPGKRSGSFKPLRGSKEIHLRHPDQAGQFSEVVPLGEGIVCGRALVACPGWFLLMLLFLAATCLALIAEQGFLKAGVLTHFLDSKVWIFIKLGLIFSAALTALRGLFFSFFSKPVSREKTVNRNRKRGEAAT